MKKMMALVLSILVLLTGFTTAMAVARLIFQVILSKNCLRFAPI